MQREKLFMGEGADLAEAATPIWDSFGFGMEMQPNELNCGSEQLFGNCFLNPNWENSMDQSDPFESDLSSIVSSPGASNANANAIPTTGGGGCGNAVMIREPVGRLGSISHSGEISPQPYFNNNSTNSSSYSTPLNSPPKLNLSTMDSQIRGNLQNLRNSVAINPTLAPLPADPGLVERAARYSCFGSGNRGGLNGQFGLNESDLLHRLVPRVERGKLSTVASHHSMKVTGSRVTVRESNKSLTLENSEFGDSREESSVSEQIPSGEQSTKGQNGVNARKRKSIPRGQVKETPSSSPSASDTKVATENEESHAKRSKSDEAHVNEKDSAKNKEEKNGNQKQNKDSSKQLEPPKDYIHVRARRGEATDSHSLAERVRREKISERMKFLQDLVPGCNKVTGKAVMLDEIINYVQSLQRQVEFLSMKLATMNPKLDFNMNALLSKDIFQSRGAMPHSFYPLDSSVLGFPHANQSQQGLTLHNGVSSNSEIHLSMNPLNAAFRRSPSQQLPPLDGFADAARPGSTFWENDLHSVVQMGFGQDQQQSCHGSMSVAQRKFEI